MAVFETATLLLHMIIASIPASVAALDFDRGMAGFMMCEYNGKNNPAIQQFLQIDNNELLSSLFHCHIVS